MEQSISRDLMLKKLRNVRNCALQWRHHERDGVSNYWRIDCLLNRLFRCRSMNTSQPRVTGLCEGNSPHKGVESRKMFPFDDVIMVCWPVWQLQIEPSSRATGITNVPVYSIFQHTVVLLWEMSFEGPGCDLSFTFAMPRCTPHRVVQDDLMALERFPPALLSLVMGNHRSLVDSPHERTITRALIFLLMWAKRNG